MKTSEPASSAIEEVHRVAAYVEYRNIIASRYVSGATCHVLDTYAIIDFRKDEFSVSYPKLVRTRSESLPDLNLQDAANLHARWMYGGAGRYHS